ncbi:hypothetical protein C8Q75DRAFT_806406 [Abortiporus biennis]|nr:hypothetical protein C8Q75DRAFT_806406 [Abortiporus biennis]
MGLPVILTALHIFRSHSGSNPDSTDPEKGRPTDESQQSELQQEVMTEDEQAVSDIGTDEDDDSTATNLNGPTSSPIYPSRRRRFSSVSANLKSRFSRPFTRTDTTDTTISAVSVHSVYGKVKSFIFPPEDDVEQWVPSYRVTPIISGVIIPFSILLEIPGIAEHWYIRTENNTIVETKPNSAILDVGLAFSLAFALLANMCLILRFLEKSVKANTLFCILFLTLHDIINIIAVNIFGVEHRFDDGFTYGQSFWMTLCSTLVSSITNITLIVDYIRTPDFHKSGSGLTRKQRSLAIVVMTLLIYMALGALAQSFLRDLSFIDGLYFTVVTIETIGFGDITPLSTGDRIFTCFYLVFGIFLIGLSIGMIRETVLEGLEIGYRRRLQNMRDRRREARRFRRWEARWKRAVEFRLKEQGLPVWVHDQFINREGIRFVGLHGIQAGTGEGHWLKNLFRFRRPDGTSHLSGTPRGRHLNIDALSNSQLEAAALEAGVPLEMFTEHARGRDRLQYQGSEQRPSEDGLSVDQSHKVIGHDLHRPSSSNGWPSHPHTPTHAQLGRMAAMLTKVGMAGTGTHIRMLGHSSIVPTHDPEDEVETRTDVSNVGTIPRRGKTRANLVPYGRSDGAQDNVIRIDTDGVQRSVGESSSSNGERLTSEDGQVQIPRYLDPDFQDPIPKWAQDLARGINERSSVSYESYQKEMESEERKAYYAKLIVAWLLFILFWTVGSAIFMATEGWSYGVALYFCVIAFTTTGYGDYAPESPAGRSVFVVWAILGVGTMTILISVLQEAGSSRYKKALHSRLFDNAVKKYRQRESEETNRIAHQRLYSLAPSHQGSRTSHTPLEEVSPAAVVAARDTAQDALESLPAEIIKQARTFQEHLRFYVNQGNIGHEVLIARGDKKNRVPKELKNLLRDIAKLEGISDRARKEILQDEESRKTLFMLSIERTVRQMINSAEKSLAALAERDNLVNAQHRQQIFADESAVMNAIELSSPTEANSVQFQLATDHDKDKPMISRTSSTSQSRGPPISLSPLRETSFRGNYGQPVSS